MYNEQTQREVIHNYLCLGMRSGEIAKVCDMSRRTVTSILKRHGIARRSRGGPNNITERRKELQRVSKAYLKERVKQIGKSALARELRTTRWVIYDLIK